MNALRTVSNYLTYNDFFSNINNAVSTFTSRLQGIALTIIVGCLVVIGFMFIFGDGPSRMAKKWLLLIIVGAAIIFGAATLGTTIQDITNF